MSAWMGIETAPMSAWQTMETAPKDGTHILVYGLPQDTTELRFNGPGVHAAYWDEIDTAFCLDGGTWLGPFVEPTHWQPLPPAPPEGSQ